MVLSALAWARIARAFTCCCAVSAVVCGVLALRTTPERGRIDGGTRFDHVAVFAAGTPNATIDRWRSMVLGQVHKQACADGRPCVRRLMRLSAGTMEMLAFDMDPETPAVERDAILTAASLAEPSAYLRDAISPRQIASN